jgi:DNA repair protein RadC
MELRRRHQRSTLAAASLCASQDVAEYFQPRLRDIKKEESRCVLLDTKNRVIREETVSTGSLTASLVHPRETFKTAVRESAAAVIFVHNHPSGDIKPSQEDVFCSPGGSFRPATCSASRPSTMSSLAMGAISASGTTD